MRRKRNDVSKQINNKKERTGNLTPPRRNKSIRRPQKLPPPISWTKSLRLRVNTPKKKTTDDRRNGLDPHADRTIRCHRSTMSARILKVWLAHRWENGDQSNLVSMENAGHYPPKALRYRLAFGRWILGLKFSTAATVCSTSGRNFFLQKKKSLINKSIRKTKSRQCDTIRVHWRRHSISFCCLFVFCFHLKKKKKNTATSRRRRRRIGMESPLLDGRPTR